MEFKRVYLEKKSEYNEKAKFLKKEFKEFLKLENLEELRVINVYDLFNMTEAEVKEVEDKILFEETLDKKFYELKLEEDEHLIRTRFLESQFNQREDSANLLLDLILDNEEAYISHSEIIILKGIDKKDLEKVKKYYINPVEKKEIDLNKLVEKKVHNSQEKIDEIENFINMDEKELEELQDKIGVGMDLEDLEFCQNYFKDRGKNPTTLELKLIDTYWSDHCRHTTFMTELTEIEIEEGKYEKAFQEAYENYLKSREFVYGKDTDRPVFLMDMATINAKEIEKKGLLEDREDTDEVNAASIEVDVDVDGKTEKWLLMFKNETHNHPTEIEPFGGAATCLGGAIRDPLSGRSFIYQAMRITGSADPRKSFEDTIEGKLPQRKITQEAYKGYSAYGREIGVPTGFVREVYHPGYVAKRMEVGALVAAAPKENVVRGQAEPGDVILLVGGKTGRDGLGGAVGSSMKHTEDSMEESGAEVQKGNPKEERKIMRLFRKKEVANLIKVCNDFGAGGVSVAIGELAPGVKIDLDKVPLKYPGLNGEEIALSESQERMAVLIDRSNLDKFMDYAKEEDVETTLVAEVTDEQVLKMLWNGEEIVNIDRSFLDTNGVRKKSQVKVLQPKEKSFFETLPIELEGKDLKEDFINNLQDLNIGSQKGLVQSFDESAGRGTVLSQLGGENRLTPAEGMVAKIPVIDGDTNTCSLMSYGFEPKLSEWSQFHGGYYAVVESVARIVAMGGSFEKIRLSLQEYFERLEDSKEKWGKPFASLLGAYDVQRALDIPAIGGKDSMSGSFEDLHVPPTLISFAITTDEVKNIISPEFKNTNSEVGIIKLNLNEDYLLDLEELKNSYKKIKSEMDKGNIISASSIKYGGYGRAIGEMALGNDIGFEFEETKDIFKPLFGSIVVELAPGINGKEIFKNINYIKLGETIEKEEIKLKDEVIKLSEIKGKYEGVLEEVFPINRVEKEEFNIEKRDFIKNKKDKKVLIPITLGTTGEYDLKRAFEDLGAKVEEVIIKTSSKVEYEQSLKVFEEKIKEVDIIAIPDGEVLGGEPETGGKFISLILKEENIKREIENLLERKGLILGVGVGFEALIKSGLIQYGKVCDLNEDSVDIVYNKDFEFISDMSRVKVINNKTPWLALEEVGEITKEPIATRRGRIVGKDLDKIFDTQVNRVFIDNYTGSNLSVESMMSPCGQVFGTITSIERLTEELFKNVPDMKSSRIIESGLNF